MIKTQTRNVIANLSIRPLALALAVVGVGLSSVSAAELNERDQHDFFERYIRPLLLEKCSECHGSETQWNDLRVDSLGALLRGGEHGPAIVPFNIQESLLVQAIRRTGDSPMPPDAPLSLEQIERLTQWIAAGAYWPAETIAGGNTLDKTKAELQQSHWAFQPLVDAVPPVSRWPNWVRNEIDLFVAQSLDAAGLKPAAEANRATLLRRMSYDVTGLPPSPNEVVLWMQIEDDQWAREWVERLLTRPAYGEHWGRLWLDVARYSDTKGYVYAREEKNFIHAHVYRDWVIEALLRDEPYNQFIKLQLAADMITEPGDPDRAAMGYLTLGRRFIGVSHDIIDDRIDVVTRGLMGLTVACARCHDHKYDPIPTADYYSLYGVFLNSTQRRERLIEAGPQALHAADSEIDAWQTELEKRQEAFEQAMQSARTTAAERMRGKIVEYFVAQTELDKYPQEGFDQILSVDDLIPNLVHRLNLSLVKTKDQWDPRFYAWHRLAEISGEEFQRRAAEVCREIKNESDDVCHPLTRSLFDQPPQSFQQVAIAYAKLLAGEGKEVFRDFLHGENSPFEIPDELMYGIEGLFDSNACNELWKLQNEVDRWILSDGAGARFAMTLGDRDGDYPAQIFHRGDPAKRGQVVPRRMLSMLSDPAENFSDGRDRRQLAEQIASPDNPLTARVWVNRIWKQYFGEGLVRTPSDFGLRADNPSHPQLLDWLAARLIESGWSTKSIHRLILDSATYRQSSANGQTRQTRMIADQVDPENRLLWHMPAKRLSFEAMRDSMLAASGDLTQDLGGRGADLFPIDNRPGRRTIYASIDRQFVPSVLRVFDYANPDMHSPQRNETLVPQQSLFSLNHPFVAARARRLVASLASTEAGQNVEAGQRTEELFLRVLQRRPEPAERDAMLSFLASNDGEPKATVPESATVWSYGTASLVVREAEEVSEANVGDEVATIQAFQPLPFFTGSAWQGSDRYPDNRLGWAQLSAAGGHPGNDLEHAVVRRWTAPRRMEIEIESDLSHKETPGDGVRGWIISDRQGCLATGRSHNSQWEWSGRRLQVEAGERLDFVADIYKILNTDQYLWPVKIRQLTTDETSQEWNSERDFYGPPTPRLDVWEQLAQILLVSNEAMFIH